MSMYGALRGLGYLARDVWGAAVNAATPHRNDYVDHMAELLAGREAAIEVTEPDEAQADCVLGGGVVTDFGDGEDKLLSYVDGDGVVHTEKVTDAEFQDVLFNRKPVSRSNPAQRTAQLIGELSNQIADCTSSAVVDPPCVAADDGPALESPSGAGPLQLTSGDLRAAAVAAQEHARGVAAEDAPGWKRLSNRLIQAAHAMTVAATLGNDPDSVAARTVNNDVEPQ